MTPFEKQLQNIRDEVLARATCCVPISPTIITTENIMHVVCSACGRYFTTFVASSARVERVIEAPLTISGKTQTIEDWAREMGVTTKMIRRRLNSGESPKDAVFKPSKTR